MSCVNPLLRFIGCCRCCCYRNSLIVSSVNQLRVRFVHSEEALGIDAFRRWRKHRDEMLQYQKEDYLLLLKTRLSSVSAAESPAADSKSKIWVYDVENLKALVDNDHIQLLEDAVRRLHRQGTITRHTFGATLIMPHYVLNEPDRVINLLTDKELHGLFTGMTTGAIALQLLYNNREHAKILQLYHYLQQNKPYDFQGSGYPSLWMTLVFSACCQLNTRESLDFALGACDEMVSRGHTGLRQLSAIHKALIGALAVNQGRSDKAYEIYSAFGDWDTSKGLKAHGVGGRTVILEAVARLGRLERCLELLSHISRLTDSNGYKYQLTADTYGRLEVVFTALGTPHTTSHLTALHRELEAQGRYATFTLQDSLEYRPDFSVYSRAMRRRAGNADEDGAEDEIQ